MDEVLPVQRWLLRLSQLYIMWNLANPICPSVKEVSNRKEKKRHRGQKKRIKSECYFCNERR